MQFHNFITMYDIGKRAYKVSGKNFEHLVDFQKYYHGVQTDYLMDHLKGNPGARSDFNRCSAEMTYLRDQRPYYLVYPGVTKYLINLKEDKVPVSYIKMPHMAMAFRFAETERNFSFEHENRQYHLRTAFATYFSKEQLAAAQLTTETDLHDTFAIWMDFGEIDMEVVNSFKRLYNCYDENFGVVLTFRVLILKEGMTLGDSIAASNQRYSDFGIDIPFSIVEKVIRCITSCCLLSHNLEDGLIEPDVLAADRDKYLQTKDPKYIEKAKKRGKYGWIIGSSTEIDPHWRSPTPLALYWTGPGRKIPLLRFRRGTVVHRKKIEELPTGYDGQNEIRNSE